MLWMLFGNKKHLVFFNSLAKLPDSKPVHDNKGTVSGVQEHEQDPVSVEQGQHVTMNSVLVG